MEYPAHVYVIIFAGKAYVGLSHNPEKRFAAHLAHLRAGTHPVEDFQADYNASSEKRLTFCVVDEVQTESERFKEHRWQTALRSYEREHGYNYKDPTARTETEKAEMKKRVKAYLKNRIHKAVHLTTQERRAPHEHPHYSPSPDAHPRGKGETHGADKDRRREFIESINT